MGICLGGNCSKEKNSFCCCECKRNNEGTCPNPCRNTEIDGFCASDCLGYHEEEK